MHTYSPTNLPHHASSHIPRWRKLIFHTTSGGWGIPWPPYVYVCIYTHTCFLTNCRNWSGLLISEHVLLPVMIVQSWSRWAILPERSNKPGCQYRIFVLEIKRSNLMCSKTWCEGRLTLGVEASIYHHKGKEKSSTKTSSLEKTASMDNLPETRRTNWYQLHETIILTITSS